MTKQKDPLFVQCLPSKQSWACVLRGLPCGNSHSLSYACHRHCTFFKKWKMLLMYVLCMCHFHIYLGSNDFLNKENFATCTKN